MKLNVDYLVFTADTTEAEARKRYQERIGSKPEKVKLEGWYLVAGPVEVKDESK